MRITNRRFTLVEMLVVIAILVFLISLFIPKFKAMGQQTKLLECQSTLKTTAMAYSIIWSENSGNWGKNDKDGHFGDINEKISEDEERTGGLNFCPAASDPQDDATSTYWAGESTVGTGGNTSHWDDNGWEGSYSYVESVFGSTASGPRALAHPARTVIRSDGSWSKISVNFTSEALTGRSSLGGLYIKRHMEDYFINVLLADGHVEKTGSRVVPDFIDREMYQNSDFEKTNPVLVDWLTAPAVPSGWIAPSKYEWNPNINTTLR